MKRRIFTCALLAIVLSGCSGWTVEPLPYVSPSPFPSSTPIILSPTPIILPPPFTSTPDVTPIASTDTPTLTTTTATASTPTIAVTRPATETGTPTASASLTFTPTITPTPFTAVNTNILGCSNGIDITHGMGEVTNAYITVQNMGTVNLSNVCATLNILGEGRPHPDKTKCVASLPAGYQVSEKLTVDSTLGKDSPIQVEVRSGDTLLQRVAQNSCSDFNPFGPAGINFGTVTPIPTP